MTVVDSCLGLPFHTFTHPAVHGESARMALASPRDDCARQPQIMPPLTVGPRGDTATVVLFTGNRFKVVGVDAHLDPAKVIQVQASWYGPSVQFVDVPVSNVSPVVPSGVTAVPSAGRTPLPDPATVFLLDNERLPTRRLLNRRTCREDSPVMPFAHLPSETARSTITYGAVDTCGHRSSVADDSPSEAS